MNPMPKKINKTLIPALLAEAKEQLKKYEIGEAARRAVDKVYGGEGELWGAYHHIVSQKLLKEKENKPVFTETQRRHMVADSKLRELGLPEDDDEKNSYPDEESYYQTRR